MNYKKIANAFKVLGGSERIKIIRYLSTGEKCVCGIFKHLKLPQNLVSYHLGALRKKDLIIARKEGKWVYYSLNENGIEELKTFLCEVLQKEKNDHTC
ncbi:MAG: metalloregulator ArsR/SmtB family transcription factor [Candidatus Paceibacterota bacterium]|jgi:ArsR family transcriptional regulator|nr:metalloregulator ArsR/SmtB family transcription factor [Candidatus Paceibacterota bacterium]